MLRRFSAGLIVAFAFMAPLAVTSKGYKLSTVYRKLIPNSMC
jgi:hypothetical protein